MPFFGTNQRLVPFTILSSFPCGNKKKFLRNFFLKNPLKILSWKSFSENFSESLLPKTALNGLFLQGGLFYQSGPFSPGKGVSFIIKEDRLSAFNIKPFKQLRQAGSRFAGIQVGILPSHVRPHPAGVHCDHTDAAV